MQQQLQDAQVAAWKADDASVENDARQDQLIKNNRRLADAAQTTAAGTETLAGVGGGQLATAQDTAKRQLRAYVFAVPAVVGDFEPGKKPYWPVEIKGIGQTPAYAVTAVSHIAVLNYPRSNFAGVWVPPPTDTTSGILFPETGFSQTLRLNESFRSDQFEILRQSKSSRLYLWGRISYKDSFGAPHFKRFCFSYNAAANPHPTIEACNFHNDGD